MKNGILNSEKLEEMKNEIKQEINEATEYAENAPYADVATLEDHVYASKGEV